MTEETTDIHEIVKSKATKSGNVTFATRDFGRGTNFMCRDKIVLASGGVHIILTFWSESRSEEEQIKGRTARNGNAGSYQIILLKQDLEIIGVDYQVLESASQEFLE